MVHRSARDQAPRGSRRHLTFWLVHAWSQVPPPLRSGDRSRPALLAWPVRVAGGLPPTCREVAGRPALATGGFCHICPLSRPDRVMISRRGTPRRARRLPRRPGRPRSRCRELCLQDRRRQTGPGEALAEAKRDLKLKEQALARTRPPNGRPGRYQGQGRQVLQLVCREHPVLDRLSCSRMVD